MYQPSFIKRLYHQSRRFLAKKWLRFWKPYQIAIGGSQGKTNTARALAKVLSKFSHTVVTDINLDTIFNVPITALKVMPWTKFAVFELGVDHIGEMNKHFEIVTPKIGVVTGISAVHTDSEHFGTLENLIKEERKLIEFLPKKEEGGVAILNYDDEDVRNMASFTKAKVIFYGHKKEKCQYYFDKNSVKVSLGGTQFKLFSKSSNNFQYVSTKLIGLHHAYNLTAVFAVLKTIFHNHSEVYNIFNKTVSEIEPLRGRMNIEKGPMETTLLNDCLRASPKSTDEGLKTFYKIDYKKGRKIAILGVMGELYDPIKEHKNTAKTIISYPPDIVIGVGDYRKYTIDEAKNLGFPKEKLFFAKDVFEAADILKKIIKPGDFLYLKSSLLRNLWRIIKILNNQPICCRKELCPYEHCRL